MRQQHQVAPAGMRRPWYMRPHMTETLAPLVEGLSADDSYEEETKPRNEKSWDLVRGWVRGQLKRRALPLTLGTGFKRSSDLRLLLGVLGCPLAPVGVSTAPLPHLSTTDICTESSCAQYIVQQYIAATGGAKVQNAIKSSYTMGRVKMVAGECETGRKVRKKGKETGCFVLWQMMPDMWSVEMVVAGSKVHAGSNGKIVWRHTPWLGSHAAKGPVRPLRRSLQGLDPRSIASVFANARCVGEKRIGEEECFILKLAADHSALTDRSEGPAEMIKHVLLGYFSQRTGLLVFMEDSHLTRIEATGAGAGAVYWESSIETSIGDYRGVDGVMIAHSGRSVVTLYRFGDAGMGHSKSRMEETWSIEDVVFNVPGLSMDCFIPPAHLINASHSPHCQPN